MKSKKSKVSCLFIDIDGTLLQTENEYLEFCPKKETIEALLTFLKKDTINNKIIFATARAVSDIILLEKNIQKKLTSKEDKEFFNSTRTFKIASSGMFIYKGLERLNDIELKNDIILDVLPIFLKMNHLDFLMLYYGKDVENGLFVPLKNNQDILKRGKKLFKATIEKECSCFICLKDFIINEADVTKIVTYGNLEHSSTKTLEKLKSNKKLFEKLNSSVELSSGSDKSFEIVPIGYTKGTAIDKTMKILSLNKNNIAAFGDSFVDISMFNRSISKNTFLMKNYDKGVEEIMNEKNIKYNIVESVDKGIDMLIDN